MSINMKNKLNEYVTLAHGNGGILMRQLIKEVFLKYFDSGIEQLEKDACEMQLPKGNIMITTDGFTVQPLEFPGGNIGSLAVNGTINDLAVSGAKPIYLTLSVFIEEGFSVATLKRIVKTMAESEYSS